MDEGQLIDRARAGDSTAFDDLVAPYRGELHAHCYRLLGSVHDADDAVQDALLGAWKGLAGFEGRSSLRGWLYRITTNAALKLGGRRPKRLLSLDYGPPTGSPHDLGDMVGEPIWLEPYPTGAPGGEHPADPAAQYDAREAVELAFVAALQHLPARQRAVLILHEVLAFSAAEVAAVLDTSVAAVNSALQRARSALARKVLGPPTQKEQLRKLGDPGRRRLVEQFVSAWERSDVPALLNLLVEDARLSMPPLPAWFDGRESVGRFMSERMFATSWKLIPTEANGQLAFGCYQAESDGAPYLLAAVIVVTIEGDRIAEITAFLDPKVHELFGLPAGVS